MVKIKLLIKTLTKLAGQDFLKQDYNLKDFIQTSILSFAAGGLVGGVSTANFASPNSKKARLADMFLLGKDLKGTKAKFDFAVSKNKISRTDADELLNQIKALQKARVPVWMLSNP